jgi:EmrB/QacA subfamily drug resistance transporter
MTENTRTSKRVALLASAMASFLTPFMGSAVTIALPSIGREFSMDAVSMGWVSTSYLLASAALLIPLGKLADIYGRKRLFTLGIAIYTVFSLLSGLAGSATALVLFRVLHGCGSAMIYGTGVAILTSVFPPGERGKALGTNVAATYTGLSLGPVLGGLLTQNLGWRSIFLVNVPLGLAVIVLVLWKLKGEWAEARGERLDWVGSILCGGAMVAVIIGLSRLPQLEGAILILLGALGIAAFVWWELRVDQPVLSMELFKGNRVFAFSSLAALINYMATFAVTFFLSLYLQYTKAMTPQQAGLVLVAQPVVMALLSPLVGTLSDRIEPRLIASGGMAVTVIGLLLLLLLGPTTSVVLIVAILLLHGLGFALFSSPNMNAIMSGVTRKSYGVASAMLGTMRLTGQMLSMGLAMLILALIVGRVEVGVADPADFLRAIRTAFAVFAGICVVGVLASLARGNIRRMGDDKMSEMGVVNND